jgi:tetratricopeptide (TPR) repeat protein
MKNFLKTTLLSVLIGKLLIIASFAQTITTPRTPSPAASVSQTLGISTVTVKYSRPSVKERQIWGKIVPYGWNKEPFGSGKESPWRAGANENTVIEFSHPGKIEGKEVPAGSYGLFFVVNENNSGEIILSKDYKSWGNYWYDPANDLLRANIETRVIPHTEALTYEFINLTKNTAELVLNWEKKQIPVKIEFAVDDLVMANAENELKGGIGFTWQGNASAANYALQNNVATDKAMIWINRAVAQNANFTTLRIKSGLLKKAGNNAEAEKLMIDAMAVASEGELNGYGYELINENNFDKAIEILEINTKRHPNSANAWDSLGEAYALKGDKKNAVKNFKKSLSLNPPENVRLNSEKYLKQLGAI